MLNWLRRLWRRTKPAPVPDTAVAYTRPATWEDVLTVAHLLQQYEVRYVLIGGYALAAHGYVRMTQDIDIAVSPEPANSARWIAALSRLPDHASADMASEQDPFDGDYLHAIRINDEFTLDILPSVAGVPFETLDAHAETMEVDGISLRVLDLDGLLMTKQGVRAKDRADREILVEALERLRSRDPERK